LRCRLGDQALDPARWLFKRLGVDAFDVEPRDDSREKKPVTLRKSFAAVGAFLVRAKVRLTQSPGGNGTLSEMGEAVVVAPGDVGPWARN